MATANKMYSSILSYDYIDFKHGNGNPKCKSRKLWSKKLRGMLKRDFKKQLKTTTYEN